MGILTIGEREFSITESTLSGGLYSESGGPRVASSGTWLRRQLTSSLRWRCDWILNIETEEREFIGEDPEYPDIWQPRAYSDSLPVEVNSWKAFDGLRIECEGPSQEKKCQLVGPFFLYVYEHGDITQNKLELTISSGATFNLKWDGLCDVYAGEDYAQNIPFAVTTSLDFAGIRIVESDPAIARSAIEQVLDPNEFVQQDPELWDWGDEEPPAGGPFADIWFKPRL